MDAALLKCACCSACAVAGIYLAKAISHMKCDRLAQIFERERRLVAEAAEITGVRVSVNMEKALALVGPVSRVVLNFVRRRRLLLADAQLPSALSLLCNALKAGLALPQAIEMASLELADPLGFEFARASAELKLGRTVEEALAIMGERLPTEDISLVVQSVAILKRTGGNLVETFSTLSQTVDSRLRVEERIRVITSQGVVQGAILVAMPWVLGAALFLVSPEYMKPLFSTRAGLAIAAAGILLEVAGALWLKSIVAIRV